MQRWVERIKGILGTLPLHREIDTFNIAHLKNEEEKQARMTITLKTLQDTRDEINQKMETIIAEQFSKENEALTTYHNKLQEFKGVVIAALKDAGHIETAKEIENRLLNL